MVSAVNCKYMTYIFKGDYCWGFYITIGCALTLVFNTFLWLDLNYHMYKNKNVGNIDLHKTKGIFGEIFDTIVDEITDPLYILIASSLFWTAQRIR